MLVVPFCEIHLRHLKVQDDQKSAIELLGNPEYINLLHTGPAYTGIIGNRIAVCAGVFPLTDQIGRAWALLGQDMGRDMLPITRKVAAFISSTKYDRVETPVRRGFIQGHRWCKMLGFVNETPEIGMRRYGFNGETYDLYSFLPEESHGPLKSIQQAKSAG